MKSIITEKSENIQNTFSIPSFECLCHHCSNLIPNQRVFTCSNKFCSKKYCISCLGSFYQKTTNSIYFSKNNNYSFWKCPSCEGKCLCKKCILKHSFTKTNSEVQNRNNDFLGKKISSDAELIMWLSNGEDTDIDAQNVRFPFVPLNSKIKSKTFDKLIKIAKQCELFYRHKCKNEYIKKNCSNCFETNFHQNDLLRFFNYEIFLYYMKYLFLITNKIVAYSKENFNKNKNDFEELFKKFKKKEEIWAFKDKKIICKQCMYFLINKPNFFQNIKEIFLRKEKKIFLEDGNIELNESKKYEIYFNIKNQLNKEVMKNDSFWMSKKFFDVNKIQQYKNKNNINKEVNNNIIINYNNQNSNVFNTLVFRNEFKINNNSIYNANPMSSRNFFPFINNCIMINNNNINYLNNSLCIDCNYIQLLLYGLQKELTAILGIIDLSKKDNDKLKYFSEFNSLNQKIIDFFKLIDEAVLSNLNFLNDALFKNNLTKERIEIKQKLVGLIIDNRKFLYIINCLKYNFFNTENIYIKCLCS